jgi:hypothetical protein
MDSEQYSMRQDQLLFAAGDYLVGALVGAATAAGVRAVVSPDLDMVLAMLIGTAVGMVVHQAIGLAASPLLGVFHCMVPGGLIGMYGGMLFAMRDAMQHHPGSLRRALVVGIIFGAAVTAAVRLYDRALRDTGPRNPSR